MAEGGRNAHARGTPPSSLKKLQDISRKKNYLFYITQRTNKTQRNAELIYHSSCLDLSTHVRGFYRTNLLYFLCDNCIQFRNSTLQKVSVFEVQSIE